MKVKCFTEQILYLMFRISEYVGWLASRRISASIVNKQTILLVNTILRWICPNDIVTVKGFTEQILHLMFQILEYVCWLVSHWISASIVNKLALWLENTILRSIDPNDIMMVKKFYRTNLAFNVLNFRICFDD